MKKFLLVSLLLAATALTVTADVVTLEQAAATARGYVVGGSGRFSTGSGASLKLAHRAVSTAGLPDYYVFNNGTNGGYVIVGGDDRAVPVWGYSTSGAFDYDALPDNAKWWLGEYQRQLQFLRDNPQVKARKAVKLTTAVFPLLTTKWNQCAPYNHFCPSAKGNIPMNEGMNTYVYQAATGCVATALAQIMNYHKWPAIGEGKKTYSTIVKEFESQGSDVEKNTPITLTADFSQSVYNWGQMKDEYNVFYDYQNNSAITYQYINGDGNWIKDNNFAINTPNGAVAKLMSDIGIAVSMTYGDGARGGSSANAVGTIDGMQNHFRYLATLHSRSDDEYVTAGGWDKMLREELESRRPIFYGAERLASEPNEPHSAHAFVFDGYNDDGMFHVNWGWGGDHNNYFYSTLLEDEANYPLNHKAIFFVPNRDAKSLSSQMTGKSFGKIKTGSRGTASLSVVGQNLDEDVTISLSGDDAAMFSTVGTVSAAAANAEGGQAVKVTYQPTKSGVHTATLTVSAGDGVQPITFTITGTSTTNYDTNGDDKADVTDVVAAIQAVLNGDEVPFTDDKIDVTTIVAMINAVLYGETAVGLDDGLVAYYPFDGNADDASGNGNHGTAYNLSLTRGVSGDTRGAYRFGGVDNPGYIVVPNSETLKFTDGFTFACFVKPESWRGMDGWGHTVNSGGHCIFAKSSDRNSPHMSINNGSDDGVVVNVGSFVDKWCELGSGDKLQGDYLDSWMHIAATYGKNGGRLYVNGRLVAQNTLTPNFTNMNANDLYMGRFLTGSWWYPLCGVMDEVRIYNRALTADEVKDLAADNVTTREQKNPFKLSHKAVTLAAGESLTVEMLNGGGSYSVGSNVSVVDFKLDNDNERFTLTGVAEGQTNVTVIDVNTQTTIMLPVTVTAPQHDWVDLGLPSGTLWATCNVGANAPEEYGDYFAWGETEPKDYYWWDCYKWYNGFVDGYNTFKKYNTNSSQGTVDNKTELDMEDDAASVNWSSAWRTPSSDQMQELINCCTWTWTTLNGVTGQLVTGPNGKTIFLPAAGYHEKNAFEEGSIGRCYYWSRTLNAGSSGNAKILYYGVDWIYENLMIGPMSRLEGVPVRPVRR